MENIGLRIRLQRELHEQFIMICTAEDRSAARIVHEFTQQHVVLHKSLQSQNEEDTEASSRHLELSKKGIRKEFMTEFSDQGNLL